MIELNPKQAAIMERKRDRITSKLEYPTEANLDALFGDEDEE